MFTLHEMAKISSIQACHSKTSQKSITKKNRDDSTQAVSQLFTIASITKSVDHQEDVKVTAIDCSLMHFSCDHHDNKT
jgi:hypothetical protein